MKRFPDILQFFLVLLLLHDPLSSHAAATPEEERKYIVFMDHDALEVGPAAAITEQVGLYTSSLKSVSTKAEMGYIYQHIKGFTARITATEAKALEDRPEVLAVMADTILHVHTTRSPSFLGIENSPAFSTVCEKASTDVVVGVLDTGVWPESKSFKDEGYPSAKPSSWRGTCGFENQSLCNNKLIGAKFFSKGFEAEYLNATNGTRFDWTKESQSPRDFNGHGSHTSSTATGSLVRDASLNGLAAGSARGMAPCARLAVYKVCWTQMGVCSSADILAGMDAAISDNVNVLSLSLGGEGKPFYADFVSIGAFRAMEKGILVSCSGGNSGPAMFSVANVAPWITTVGAGTLDRDFPVELRLGNRMKYPGLSFYNNNNHTLPAGEMLPFVHAGNVSSSGNSTAAGFCLEGTLDPKKVQGKIVFCYRGENGRVAKGKVIKAVGGKGMVLADGITDVFPVADVHVLPAIAVDYETGKQIEKYLLSSSGSGNNNGNNTAKAATATMTFYGTRVGVKPSPVVASFSSRGPNPITPEILKPDLIAPGVNILAAWTGGVSQTKVENDPIVDFNIDSGTSMSCPHVSGIAAVLKAANPEWSPTAIRSALMTTAYMQYPDDTGTLIDDATRKQGTPFDFGAGMVSPGLALNPGLVYDMNSRDYLHFLCPLNYTSKQLQTLTRDKSLTCDPNEIYSLTHLNYPSFAIIFALHKGAAVIQQPPVTHVRTLTNVRDTVESYKVSVSLPTSSFVSISVEPEILSFNGKKDKKSYNVTFISNNKPPPKNTNVFGVIKWVSSDGKTTVQSPVAVSWYYDS